MVNVTTLKDIDDRIYEVRKHIHNTTELGYLTMEDTIEPITFYNALSTELLALATLRATYLSK